MHVHGSLFLSFQLQLDSNATRTLNNNQILTHRRSHISSPVSLLANANADSDATNVSASASGKSGCFRPPKPKSGFKLKNKKHPNNVSVSGPSGISEETLKLTKRPRGRPRKNRAPAADSEEYHLKKGASLDTTTKVPKRSGPKAKHKFLQWKIKKAADLLGAAASTMKEVEDIATAINAH